MPPDIDIIPYTTELKEHIKTLNYEWLEKWFHVEPGDARSLCNPQTEIIDKGGVIYYARWKGEIIGTASLLFVAEGIFELGKMAVTSKAQGLGIGTLLLEHCISVAQEMGAHKMVLYSNTKLQTAIRLYRKYGFTECTLEPGLYERADIKMERHL